MNCRKPAARARIAPLGATALLTLAAFALSQPAEANTDRRTRLALDQDWAVDPFNIGVVYATSTDTSQTQTTSPTPLPPAPAAPAASGSWIGDANGTQNWSAPANWSGGIIADGIGATGNFTFDITGNRNVTIDTLSRTLGIMNIGDAAGSPRRTYTITNSGGASLIFDNTSNAANAQLNQTSTSAGDTISAPIQVVSSLDISNASANALTISGTITTTTAGTKTISNLGTGAGGVLLNGVISDGSGTLAVTQNSATSALTLGGATANTYTGLTTASAGTLNLGKTASGVNAFGGDLTINGGNVVYSTTSNNQIPDSAKVTISSGSLAFGARDETIGSIGTPTSGLALSGGSITLSSGSVNFNNSITMTGGSMTLTSSGLITMNADFAFSGGTINSTYGGGSSSGVSLRGGNGTGITYSASGTSTAIISNTGGGSAKLSLNNAASATTVFNIADAPSVATELNISMAITGAATNPLQKTGDGVLQFSGTIANTYSGLTTVSGGELDLNKTAGVNAIAGNLTVGDGIGTDIVKLLASDQIANTSAVTVSGGTFDLQTFSETVGAVTLTSGSIISTTGILTGSSYAVESGTISAILAGTAALTKTTAGTVVLSGNNTYSGTTTISAGTLQLGNGGTGGSLSTSSTITDNGNFTINQSDTVTQGTDFSGSGISGVGSFTQAGTGTTIFTAANTYSGTTTISAGTLQIGNGGTTGTLGSGGVTNNSALVFNRSDALTVGNLISGTGSVTQAGTGTTTLTAANTYSGGTTVSGGTLMANNVTGSATGTGLVTVNSGARLGGSGTVGDVNVSGTLLGGNGTTGTTLTVGNLTMNSGSFVQLALGPSLTHSTLALTGTYSFQSDQTFQFINLGATTGTYDNIITGTPTDPGVAGWQFDNSFNVGFTGSFVWDGANVDLVLTAVPEPSTWAGASLALVALLVHQRRRLKRVLNRR